MRRIPAILPPCPQHHRFNCGLARGGVRERNKKRAASADDPRRPHGSGSFVLVTFARACRLSTGSVGLEKLDFDLTDSEVRMLIDKFDENLDGAIELLR